MITAVGRDGDGQRDVDVRSRVADTGGKTQVVAVRFIEGHSLQNGVGYESFFHIASEVVFGKDFIKEHTLVCSAYHYFKDEIKSLTQFDLKNQKGNIILKLGLISGIYIEGILLFVYFFMGIIGNLYYISPRIYLIFTCFISLICAIIIMLISKKLLSKVSK